MTYLLDTDTFTLAHHRTHGLRERIEAARRQSHAVDVTTVTRLEVLRGRVAAVLKAATGADVLRMQARLAESEAYLAGFRVVPFDPAAAALFDTLKGEKSLRKVGQDDLLIASIALALSATVVTRNTTDFAPIPNLKIENWAA